MGEPFICEIRIWGCNFAPRGWTMCNGGTLQIAQNTAVFSLIGTTYGGDGRTTCGIPNLEGMAPMHAGNGPGLTPRKLGEHGGTETETITQQQTPTHTHTFLADEEDADATSPSGATAAIGVDMYANPGSLVNMADGSLAKVGGGQAHPNLQPYQTFNFCMALVGVYPSRS